LLIREERSYLTFPCISEQQKYETVGHYLLTRDSCKW